MMRSIVGQTTPEGNITRGTSSPVKPRGRHRVRGRRFFLFFFLFLLLGWEEDAAKSSSSALSSASSLLTCWGERRPTGTSASAKNSLSNTCLRFSRFLSFSSSSCFFSDKYCSRRNRRGGAVDVVVAAQHRHHQSPAECRTVRSLRCGPGSKKTARPHPPEWRLLCP